MGRVREKASRGEQPESEQGRSMGLRRNEDCVFEVVKIRRPGVFRERERIVLTRCSPS